MFPHLLATLFCTGVRSHEVGHTFHGLRSSRSWLPQEPLVLTATGEELMKDRNLPKHFDWRNVNGRNFATADVNQHIPQYCGACWIHGTVAALNDRIKVMRNGAFPDIMLSRQALINCVPGEQNHSAGCFGGDPQMIYKHMKDTKIPDETCSPYKAENDQCLPWTMCGNCDPPAGFVEALEAGKDIGRMGFDMAGGCYPIPHYTGFRVSQFGEIRAREVEAMMKEIYARGPITCVFNAPDFFMYNYSEVAEQHEGVFVSDVKYNDTDHVVEVAGWGETPSGLKYWIARNSWGTYWGDDGWFKFRRGVDQYLIESYCSWAVPDFEDQTLVDEGRILGDYVSGTHILSSSLADVPAGEPQLSWSSVSVAMIAASASCFCAGMFVAKVGQRRLPREFLLLG